MAAERWIEARIARAGLARAFGAIHLAQAVLASSAPHLVTARASGARVTVTAVGVGRATIRLRPPTPAGLSGSQSFGVRVTAPFTDDPLRPGESPIIRPLE